MVAESPEAETQAESTNCLNSGGGFGLRRGNSAAPSLVLCGKWADGVGEVVCAMGNRHEHRGTDLGCGPEVLDFAFVDGGAGVDVVEAFGLVLDGVSGDSIGEDELYGCPDAEGMCPRECVDPFEAFGVGGLLELTAGLISVDIVSRY